MQSLLKINDYLMEYYHAQEDDIQYVPNHYLWIVLEPRLLMDNMHKPLNKFNYFKIFYFKILNYNNLQPLMASSDNDHKAKVFLCLY